MPLVVRLIHWNEKEAGERAAIVRDAGYMVLHERFDPAALRELRDNPPSLILIDLSRLPSRGRDVGVRLRHTKSTRHIPLVFVGGEKEKVDRVREVLPDAIFTSWKDVARAIGRGLASPPLDAIAPTSVFSPFAGTPLLAKLGVREKMRLALVNAPDEIEEILGELPDGTGIERRATSGADLIIWFVRSRRELEGDIEWMRGKIGRGGIWIAWPKRSAVRTIDLTQLIVREICNGVGLVDYKVASFDATWTGMRFAIRK